MCYLVTLGMPKGVKPFEPPIDPDTGEEPFSIKETVYLSTSQLIEGVPVIKEDKLYVIRRPTS